jgi:flagellin-like protein
MHRGPLVGETTDRGQTAVTGLALMIFFALVLVGAVVVFGITAVSDGEAATSFAQAERSMAVFDAESERIAFDDSGTETVHFGSTGSGRVFVVPDRGRIRVVQDYNNTTTSPDTQISAVLYNRSLGSLRYQTTRGRPGSALVQRSLAYEGGGVFRYGGNETTTVAEPNLALRAGESDNVTLTVPVIRTNGTGAAQGDVRTRISAANDTGRVFPNASGFYSDGTNHTNALPRSDRADGNVTVFVTSDYYRGWAAHLRSEGNVSETASRVRTFPSNRTVKARFVVGGGNVTHLHVMDNAVHVRVH